MKIEDIAPFNAPLGEPDRTHLLPKPATVRPNHTINSQPGSDTVSTTALDHQRLNRLDASNDASQIIAQEIRSVTQSFEAIHSNLQKMQAALEGIVKMFPPYPIGSSERIEALRQFSGFRKMIDQIAQPDPNGSLNRILGDPRGNPHIGDWRMPIDDGDSNLTVRHQPVHTGPNGLNIPSMDAGSTDQQIHSTIDRVSYAIQTLEAKRQDFISDANQVISQIS